MNFYSKQYSKHLTYYLKQIYEKTLFIMIINKLNIFYNSSDNKMNFDIK